MAVSYNDKYLLSQDVTFQNRVRASMITACLAIKTESPTTTAFHREREAYLVGIMNAPDTYKLLFANAVATNTTVINDATATGTVTLTGANVAAQAANVTDVDIDNAISAAFNSFFRTPAN